MGDKHIVRYTLPFLGGDGHATWVGELPEGAEVLDAGALYGRQACLWVLEDVPDPNAQEGPQMQKVQYELYGTGRLIPGDMQGLEFKGTAQMGGGDSVVHIFENTQPASAAGGTEGAGCKPCDPQPTAPVAPGNGSGNDASNPPQPAPDQGGGGESTPGNSPPSAPPVGQPPAAPEPTTPPPAPPVAPSPENPNPQAGTGGPGPTQPQPVPGTPNPGQPVPPPGFVKPARRK